MSTAGVPAFTRHDVDDRRASLLELGAQLFTTRSYAELSMSAIAKEAGISKALLYHYFPSKQELFRATLAQAAEQLAEAVAPDPSLSADAQLTASLEAYLLWVQERPDAFDRLLRTAHEVPEVRALVDEVRDATCERILATVTPAGSPPSPAARTAVRGWLWFLDGAVLDWLEHRDLARPELHGLLLDTLRGCLVAAGARDPQRS